MAQEEDFVVTLMAIAFSFVDAGVSEFLFVVVSSDASERNKPSFYLTGNR
jgi:hypothetical protein